MGTERLTVEDPSADQLRAVASSRIFFGHQSVGSNVLGGLDALARDLAVPELKITETRSASEVVAGTMAHAHVGRNRDPQSKIDEFAAIMNGPMASAVQIALLKLCYIDVTASSDPAAVFDAYASTLDDLSRRHPGVTFLAVTVPLARDPGWKGVVKSWLGKNNDMGPADNVARQTFNQLLRERYAGTGRLFDIAAVEAAMDQAPTRRSRGGTEYYVLHEAFSSDPGHLNALGSRAAAAELVRTLAANLPPS